MIAGLSMALSTSRNRSWAKPSGASSSTHHRTRPDLGQRLPAPLRHPRRRPPCRRRVRRRLARLMALLRAGARHPPAHHLGRQRLAARLRRLGRPTRRLHTRRLRRRRPRAGRPPRRHLRGVRRALDGHARRPTPRRVAPRDGGRPRLDRRVEPAPRRRVRRRVVSRTGPHRPHQRAIRSRVPVEHPRGPGPGPLLRPTRRREPPGASPRLARRLRRHPHHARDTAITAPTLLLWGDQDALVPRTEQDTLLAAIPGSRLVVYNGAGHSPNWEEPKRVARDIETFLRQPAAEPSPAR